MAPETKALVVGSVRYAALAAAVVSGVRVLTGRVEWILWPWELGAEFAIFFAAIFAWRWLRARPWRAPRT